MFMSLSALSATVGNLVIGRYIPEGINRALTPLKDSANDLGAFFWATLPRSWTASPSPKTHLGSTNSDSPTDRKTKRSARESLTGSGHIVATQVALMGISAIAASWIIHKGCRFYLTSDTMIDKVKSIGVAALDGLMLLPE